MMRTRNCGVYSLAIRACVKAGQLDQAVRLLRATSIKCQLRSQLSCTASSLMLFSELFSAVFGWFSTRLPNASCTASCTASLDKVRQDRRPSRGTPFSSHRT